MIILFVILIVSEETDRQTDKLVHNRYLLWWLLSTSFFVFVFSFSFSSFSHSLFLQLNKYKTVDSQSIQYMVTVWVSSHSQYRRVGGSETPDLVSTSGGRVTQFSNLWSKWYECKVWSLIRSFMCRCTSWLFILPSTFKLPPPTPNFPLLHLFPPLSI